MMIPFLLLMSFLTYADPTWKWTNAIKVVEKHEFYKNNELIQKPKGIWQTLFAVMYRDANLKILKDCVYYKIPGDEPGHLKIKTIQEFEKCDDFLYSPQDLEWKDLKALQYSITDHLITISITNAKFEIERWDAPLFNVFNRPAPTNLLSSAEYRSPKIMFLNPYKGNLIVKPQPTQEQAEQKICHDISEDCKELSPSTCMSCPEGWYEKPNGCAQGPKFCGKVTCGTKNAPACRRGYKWQRLEKVYSCRDDSSFAYCAKGLRVHCEGHLPYCI